MKRFELTATETISLFNAQKKLRSVRHLSNKDMPERVLEEVGNIDFSILPVWDTGLVIIPNIWDDENETWVAGERIQLIFPKGWTIPGDNILPPKAGFTVFKSDSDEEHLERR